jgi:hypothetical protein
LPIANRGLAKAPGDLDLNYALCKIGVSLGIPDLIEKGGNGYLAAWNERARNPNSDDGRFVYFATKGSICYVLHKLSIGHLHMGRTLAEQFYKFLPQAEQPIRDAIADDMKTDLEKTGFDFLIGG